VCDLRRVVWIGGLLSDAAQPDVAADLLLAYARKQAAERQGRWADALEP
jgi:hypothetical protein